MPTKKQLNRQREVDFMFPELRREGDPLKMSYKDAKKRREDLWPQGYLSEPFKIPSEKELQNEIEIERERISAMKEILSRGLIQHGQLAFHPDNEERLKELKLIFKPEGYKYYYLTNFAISISCFLEKD